MKSIYGNTSHALFDQDLPFSIKFYEEPVFADPKRLIVPNQFHSSKEDRFYAIGHDGLGVLTVRFTLRNGAIRVIGAGYWRKQRRLYEKAQTELHE